MSPTHVCLPLPRRPSQNKNKNKKSLALWKCGCGFSWEPQGSKESWTPRAAANLPAQPQRARRQVPKTQSSQKDAAAAACIVAALSCSCPGPGLGLPAAPSQPAPLPQPPLPQCCIVPGGRFGGGGSERAPHRALGCSLVASSASHLIPRRRPGRAASRAGSGAGCAAGLVHLPLAPHRAARTGVAGKCSSQPGTASWSPRRRDHRHPKTQEGDCRPKKER